MIACTHSNDGNYFSMQIASDFFSNDIYYRSVNNSGSAAWSRFLLSTNFTSFAISNQNDVWITSREGTGRFYFSPSGRTFFRSGNGFEFRSAADANIGEILNGGNWIASADMRAPIFYDSNNTGYFLDPTATTSIRTVGSWRSDSAAWDGEFAGKIQYHSSSWYIQFNNNIIGRNGSGTDVFRVDSSGNVIGNGNITAYGSASDIKLKENIENIPNALEKLLTLNGVNFNYKKDGLRATGVIAQEVEKVLPEVIYETTDAEGTETFKAVRYGNMVGLLIEAIKELKAEIDELKSR